MHVFDLGIKPYEESLGFQSELLERRLSGVIGDALILVEHFPVVTLGKLDREDNVPGGRHFSDRGIRVVRSGRGGKTTYHSPGQLVMYPVISLDNRKKDISFYIDFLEKTITHSLKILGIDARREEARRGVWVGSKKIAFTGIAVRRWITYHGAAVNINNDTDGFRHIHPCGDKAIEVTSAKEVLGRELDMREVRSVFAACFQEDIEKEYACVTVA